MRSAVQQALAADAAAVAREAASLARRRGHARVTPLHVASAMLAGSAGGGLLRAACLRAPSGGSRPLRCEALELCFNAALSRLATAGPPPAVTFHAGAGHPAPALSNALAAAFKRAQANQRRGGGYSASADGRQTAKVGLKQLVVSILDDPSVSRVMGEAGFSSAEVKACVEKAASSEHSSNTASIRSSAFPSPNPKESEAKVDVAGDATRVLDCMASGASELAYCGVDGRVAATAATVPTWLRRCQGPALTGSDLTLSFSSPAASSISGFTHYEPNLSSNPWHDRRQPWPSHRHDGPMVEPHDVHLLMKHYPVSSSSVSMSNSSEGAREPAARRRRKFTELTAENLRILCDELETRVPRHRDVAPGIASALLRRRSGVTRTPRRGCLTTWLLFQGGDSGGKTAMARELARLVFGSYAEFTSVAPTELTAPAHSAGSSSGGDLGLKRQRPPENEHGYVQRLYEAVLENPHRVVLIDGVERSDDDTEAGIKNAIATGTVRGCNGDVVRLEDAIVVLSFEAFEPRSRAPSPRRVKQRVMADVDGKEEEGGREKGAMHQCFSLDLNACAIDGEGEEEGSSLDDFEILDVVDGVFSFRS
ncbi:hypothetical protein ACP70R_021275 [Stipagrostis hirtigluma subsp. patula]